MKYKFSNFFGIFIVGIICFSITFIIYSLVGISIFSFLGVKFTSIKAIFVYMLLFCILSTILELFTDSFIEIVINSKYLTKNFIFILKLFISVPTKTLVILLADILSKNVEINFLSALLGAFLLFVFEYKTDELLDKNNNYLDGLASTKEKAINEMEDTLNKFEEELQKKQ